MRKMKFGKNLTFIFPGSHKKFFLVLLLMIYYIFSS